MGLITSSGSLGLLFAPSLPLILYGIVAEVSVDDLFVAGVLPGILMIVVLGAYCYWRNRKLRYVVSEGSWSAAWQAIWAARWDLPLPIVVLGGIYGGYFAVSEAAAVTALYVTVVELVVLREVAWRDLPRIMRESMVLVGAILVILGVSLASTNLMIDTGVPQRLFAFVSDYVTGPTTFLHRAARVSLDLGRDPGHFLGHRADRAAAAADRGAVRHRSRSTSVSCSWPRWSSAISRRRSG